MCVCSGWIVIDYLTEEAGETHWNAKSEWDLNWHGVVGRRWKALCRKIRSRNEYGLGAVKRISF